MSRSDAVYFRVELTHRCGALIPEENGHAPYAWLYKPEFIAITGRSFTFAGLERASVNGQSIWVQQCWLCAYADDAQFERWVRSLEKVPDWVVLVAGR